MGTALLDTDLFCYARGLMLSLSDTDQADVIETLYSTSIYLDSMYMLKMIGYRYNKIRKAVSEFYYRHL